MPGRLDAAATGTRAAARSRVAALRPGPGSALITTTGQVARRRHARITGPAERGAPGVVARRAEDQHVRARAAVKQDPRGEAVDDLDADLDVGGLVGLNLAHQVIESRRRLHR